MNEKGIVKILICDDDPADRKLIRSHLSAIEDIEFDIAEAGDTQEIDDALRNKATDMVLMDLRMPGKDGMEWLIEILEKSLAPVIVISGKGDEETVVEAMKKGAHDYVSKVRLSVNSLHRAITNALEKYRLQQHVNILIGLLPICLRCKKIRNDSGYWESVKKYVEEHSDLEFSHGLCPECLKELYPEEYNKLNKQIRE